MTLQFTDPVAICPIDYIKMNYLNNTDFDLKSMIGIDNLEVTADKIVKSD